MPKVCLIQRVLPHYRVPLYEQLQQALQERGIDFTLLYGQERPGTVPRTVPFEASWAHFHRNLYLSLRGMEVVCQPLSSSLLSHDLVIVEQANRLLLNYLLLLLRHTHSFQLAYWGHGRNFQARSSHSWRERFKQWHIHRVDWWFAYTERSASIVRASGYDERCITVVQNTIDTSAFQEQLRATAGSREPQRKALDIPSQAQVGLYCGGIYPDKQIDFLLTAAHHIKTQCPLFHLIVVGEGPDAPKVRRAAQQHSWIHYQGPAFGEQKARYFHASDALLMPGSVGLVLIDSFVAQTPLFTTNRPNHGPEASYLTHGHNGMMTPPSKTLYAHSVAEYFRSPKRLQQLRQGCQESATRYTMATMVSNFAEGIQRCLEQR